MYAEFDLEGRVADRGTITADTTGNSTILSGRFYLTPG